MSGSIGVLQFFLPDVEAELTVDVNYTASSIDVVGPDSPALAREFDPLTTSAHESFFAGSDNSFQHVPLLWAHPSELGPR
jgi:hypothetical protein